MTRSRACLSGRIIGPLAALAVLIAALMLAAPTRAAFPGENGKLAFSMAIYDYEIYVISPDGTGLADITNRPGFDGTPAWSPDGTRIAFGTHPEIYVMNADGSEQTNLTNRRALEYEPTWSPDGTRIAFIRFVFTSPGSGNDEIYVMNPDGSNPSNLTNDPAIDLEPAWSPDGTKIAFTSLRDRGLQIYVMNTDGSNQTQLTTGPDFAFSPNWSPDGTRLALEKGGDVYTMKADGTDQINLTNRPGLDGGPVWSPDGSRIAFTRDGGDIYTMNADGSQPTRVTGGNVFGHADWQPIPNDPSRFKNRSAFCRAQRGALGDDAFTKRYGGNGNAFGKCVSRAER